jgi:DNA-binding PadR family transcriptional regulator
MESSTSNLPTVTELEEKTGLSKPTILKAMHTLDRAGIITGTEDRPGATEFRPMRINYEFTPNGLNFVRLARRKPEST